MIALISDIHANFEALCAVMGDIKDRGVETVICLGDIVGYGPDPEKCTDLVMQEAKLTIMGNHDFALLNAPLGFNPLAAEVIRKTQEIMRPESDNESIFNDPIENHVYTCVEQQGMPRCLVMEHPKTARWDFLRNLPDKIRQEKVFYVHGSPLDPTFEYVFPDAFGRVWDPVRIEEFFLRVDQLCFCGHTHIPCAIDSDLGCTYPPTCDYKLAFDPAKKYIINTGSVGQPRDRDKRACYLLFDEINQSVEWRRIDYDIAAVVEKSDEMCGEGNWCGARLWEGR